MPALPLSIEDLIPHRDGMKLINDVIEVNTDKAVTSSLVSDKWPLCHGSFVDSIVLIEIVAQTAGVHISWKKGTNKGAGGLGWIVGIKEADFFLERIPLQAVLITTVKNLVSTGNYTVLEGTVMTGTELLCRIQIQIFRSESD